MNVLPAKAWLEAKKCGHYSKETEEGLDLLTEYDLEGNVSSGLPRVPDVNR